MKTESQQAKLLDKVALYIDKAAQDAFALMLKDIEAGMKPREAIAAAIESFTGVYYGMLSEAFSGILERFVGVPEVRNWPVGEVTLSAALYTNTRLAQAATLQAIETYKTNIKTIRELAIEIYDGYGRGGIIDVKTALPKYLKNDAVLTDEIAREIARFRASALKTPALKAAYLEYLDKIDKQVSDKVLDKALKIAFEERNRYYANRIAQTELQRAYADKKDGAMLGDDGVEFVQWRLSQTHTRRDICDYHANADLYGLGNGIYPKHLAPTRPAHPACRCVILPKYGLSGTEWNPNPSARYQYLSTLSPQDAARTMGSRAKLQQALDGDPLDAILNKGVPDGYGYDTWGKRYQP